MTVEKILIALASTNLAFLIFELLVNAFGWLGLFELAK